MPMSFPGKSRPWSLFLLSAGFSVVSAGRASAQNPPAPAFQYEKPPEKAEDWKAQAKGGLLMTAGNSQVLNGVIGVNTSRKSGSDKLSFEGQAAYAQSHLLVPQLDAAGDVVGYDRRKETTANAWTARARYDRFLTRNNAAYALGQIGADRIAGKRLYGGAQIGYSRQLLQNEQHTLVAELGYDLSFESYLSQPGKNLDAVSIHSARVFVGELFALTKQTGINASGEALFNLNNEKALDASDPTGATTQVKMFKDTRVIGKAGLTTMLWKNVSFGFGFTVKYDQNPAPRAIPASAGGARYAPGFQAFSDKVDTLTEATLVVTFL
jgi:Protein of unknown function, DUF481